MVDVLIAFNIRLLCYWIKMKSLLISLPFILAATFAGAAEYKMTLHHFFAPKEPAQTLMLRPWADKVEELTNGKVKINIAPGMSLGGKPSDLVKQVRSGQVDLIWTINGYSGKEFLRTEVFELPFIHTNDPVATNLAMREMFESDLKEDYENLEVMFLHVHQGQAIQSKGYSVRKPEDLRGKRARVPSRTGAWVLEELGAKTVSVPVTRIPQTLQRSIATTVLVPFIIQPLLKLNLHISSFTEGHDQTRFGSVVFQVSMNKEKWNSLSPDIQSAFRKASNEDFLRKTGAMWKEKEQIGIDLMKKFKKEHIVLNKEETETFRIKLEPVIDKWIEEVEKEGIDGRKLVNKARKLIKKYEE
jgi:TRAP-type C4-dicarboxylate transport system substrate-binding protein